MQHPPVAQARDSKDAACQQQIIAEEKDELIAGHRTEQRRGKTAAHADQGGLAGIVPHRQKPGQHGQADHCGKGDKDRKQGINFGAEKEAGEEHSH